MMYLHIIIPWYQAGWYGTRTGTLYRTWLVLVEKFYSLYVYYEYVFISNAFKSLVYRATNFTLC